MRFSTAGIWPHYDLLPTRPRTVVMHRRALSCVGRLAETSPSQWSGPGWRRHKRLAVLVYRKRLRQSAGSSYHRAGSSYRGCSMLATRVYMLVSTLALTVSCQDKTHSAGRSLDIAVRAVFDCLPTWRVDAWEGSGSVWSLLSLSTHSSLQA